MSRMKKIYMDNAATTKVDPAVLETMLPYIAEDYGNASSLHVWGREADRAIERAREQVAKSIGAKPSEIYFTSGATEANNWVLNAFARERDRKRVEKPADHHHGPPKKTFEKFPGERSGRIITSRIEHPSIIETCQALEIEGFEIEYVDVDEFGSVRLDKLEEALRKCASLVSIMTASNEVGTVQDIGAIAKLCKKYNVPFHTDATQAIGKLELDVAKVGIDALSMSGHKLYGPKGAGALYVRDGIRLERFLHGGFQERKRRGGTHNTASIVGFGEAVELLFKRRDKDNKQIQELRDYLIKKIEAEIPNVSLNGHRVKRLSNNVNFSFANIEGESILIMLDFAGVAVSTGSACSSVSLEPSYVLFAMGVPIELNQGSVRFTLGRHNTREEIDYTVGELGRIVADLRAMSPLEKE